MKKNMGNLDRVIRLVIAAVLVGLIFADLVESTLAIILLVVAVVFTLISFCPLYTLLGISSCPKAKR
jgi:uncharacterized membrane protein YcaP (DUF421 family)